VSPAKTVKPIEMPFGLRTQVRPGNHVLDEVQIPPQEGAILSGKGPPIAKYSNTQAYLPDGANVLSWEGTLAPPGEYS